MACEYCHEVNLNNRRSKFCSDMCNINYLELQSQKDRKLLVKMKKYLQSIEEIRFAPEAELISTHGLLNEIIKCLEQKGVNTNEMDK